MSDQSDIEWCNATWNPVSGCTRDGPDCDNCYAVKQTYRLERMGQTAKYGGLTVLNPQGDRHFNGVVRCHEDALIIPLKWKEPRKIFVNSMSDLFHDKVTIDFCKKVFAVMAMCPHHTFQILTKRSRHMAEFTHDFYREGGYLEKMIDAAGCSDESPLDNASPKMLEELATFSALPNVWLGTSAGNQETFDRRVPPLRDVPADVRFLSLEPLLSHINLDLRGIDWVIVGGESGGRARECRVEWIRSIVQQCKVAGVRCFVKQGGALLTGNYYDKGLRQWYERHSWDWPDPIGWHECDGQPMLDARIRIETKARKGGDLLELPPSIRVRQMPKTAAVTS